MTIVAQYFRSYSFLPDMIWFVLGIITPKVIAFVARKIRLVRTDRNFQKKAMPLAPDGVYSIDHGIPDIKKQNIVFRDTQKKYLLKIPEEYMVKLQAVLDDFGNADIDEFCGKDKDDYYAPFIRYLGIDKDELYRDIDIARTEAAADLLTRIESGKQLFNGKMFGITRIIGSRTGDKEETEVSFEYMETDFYTHRVMAVLYQDYLKKGLIRPDMLESIEGINSLYPFMTSFGVDALVYLSSRHEYILCKRSGELCNMSDGSRWHMSMNEALSFTDISDESLAKKVSLDICVKRGLLEEIGVDLNAKCNNEWNIYYGDVFLVKEKFEIGITALIKIDDMLFDEIKSSRETARDSSLETTEIKAVKKKDIVSFVRKNQFTDAGRYTVVMWNNRSKLIDSDL